MTESVGLKACPFCDSAAELKCNQEPGWIGMADECGFWIECSQVATFKCFCKSGMWATPESVTQAWNRRPTPSPEAVEAARRIVEAADGMNVNRGAERQAALKRLDAAMADEFGIIQVARALLELAGDQT